MSLRNALALLVPFALVACKGPQNEHGEHGDQPEQIVQGSEHRGEHGEGHGAEHHENEGDHGRDGQGHAEIGEGHGGEAAREHGAAGTETTPKSPLEDQSYRRSITRAGKYTVLWKPLKGDVPKNKHFELEVRIYQKEDGEFTPLEGCRLGLSGWMPDHGHGMIVRPQATEVGGGKYTVRGMLFHMGGHWQFFVDVVDGGHSERAEFDVLL